MTILDDINSLGGLAATRELHQRGWSKHYIRAVVASGEIIRVRQGWYCASSLPAIFIAAARVGGPITCVTAARYLKLAARDLPTVHVSLTHNAARPRTSYDKTKRLSQNPDATIITHWTDQTVRSARLVAPVRQILRDMVWCQPPEYVVAAADSALRLGFITQQQWASDVAELPRRLRRLLARVDASSESIIESLMRFRLAAMGIASRSQVRIHGVGRVDLLIGEKLVIELDGWKYHHERDDFEEDRRRDAELARQGYRVLRFTYRQLTTEWARVRSAVLACMARHEHL
jgi:very-short-patch-repair endonuclease